MNNSKVRISKEIAPEVFALAAQLYAQEKHDYSLEDLIQAGAEVQIPSELIQKAFEQISAKQIHARKWRRKLQLILVSGSSGAAIAFLGFWGYDTLANTFTQAGRQDTSLHFNNQDTAPIVVSRGDGNTFTGQIQQYLLNPEGKVDGLLLTNGLQIKFPPHMGDSLVSIVTQGTKITVNGNPGVSTRFGQEVKAKSITNSQTGKALIAQPPQIPLQPVDSSNYSNLSVDGTAQHWLVGHRGEINGVILSNAAIVKFPPHVGNQLVNTANIGDKIQAKGFGTRNDYGQILQTTSLSINGQSISLEPKAVIAR